MRGLTVRQPWAALIAAGLKRTELRSWSTSYRGSVLIHAGAARVAGCEDLVRAAIVAVVTLHAVSPGRGGWAWHLTGALALEEPIPWGGALGLWTVPDALHREVATRLLAQRR